MEAIKTSAARIWDLVREERSDITTIYIYSIFNGAIQLSLPVGIQAIIGFVLAGTLSASLVLLISMIVLGVLLVGLLQVAQMRVSERVQQRIFVRYSFAFADKIPKFDLLKVDAFYLPELVNRFFETVSLQKSFSKLLLDLPIATIQIFFGLILLSFYHPAFILLGILLIVLLWIILYLTGNKGLQAALQESSYKYQVVGWLEEMARLVKTFKFSAGSDLHLKKADAKTENYLGSRTQHFSYLILQYRSLIAFKVAITAAMLIVGVVLLLNQQINIGQFVAAEIIILTVINAVEKIIINLDSVYDVLTALYKINKVLEKPVETTGNYITDANKGISISAEHLKFGYDSNAVIRDVNFDISAGEKICVSGNEGSGKSTLLKILTGVYKDFEGSLCFNSVPIGNYDLEALRKQTGIFFQQENVFEGTLWENLTMGREVDRNYMNTLVEECGLTKYLRTLPFGFDTILDPTGKRLPTNVVHKILFVRALAHQPQLLLMEEPWKGFETQQKNRIQEFLCSLQNTTVIVCSNDEEFKKRADKIIELSN
jgi:ATP-binding cassette subfamily B protein